ncbi:VTT domain-containing protein [Pseudobdellovibrio sp. HCB154]|uniref:VTT domain-containing protein n=1 Tax=Pseudobdellovibrio sp. HCB154 TaxID=3386277 RepID=UPI0039171E6A
MAELIHSILHLDQTLNLWLQMYGPGVYLVLFLIIFAETGLVIMPFLPGDSLLFAAGALCAINPVDLRIEFLVPLLICASLIGDSLNYYVGLKFGRRAFETKHKLSFMFSPKHLKATEEFYNKKGLWAVSLARFFPIIRTFAPFVAGLTRMSYKMFFRMSLLGSVAWVSIFTTAGYLFGQIPFVQKNFTVLVMGIVGLSLAPFLLGIIRKTFVKSL